MKAKRTFLVYLLAVMFVCCFVSGPASGGPPGGDHPWDIDGDADALVGNQGDKWASFSQMTTDDGSGGNNVNEVVLVAVKHALWYYTGYLSVDTTKSFIVKR